MANRNFTVRVVNPNNINLSVLQLLAEANTAELSSVRDEMSEMLESIDTELNWRNKIQPTLDGAKAHEGDDFWVPSTVEAFDHFMNILPPFALGVFGGFAVGEPYDYDAEGAARYLCFRRNGNEVQAAYRTLRNFRANGATEQLVPGAPGFSPAQKITA